MRYVLFLAIVLSLSACGSPTPAAPSEGQVQTAIAQTLAAQPTEAPTLEPPGTATPAQTSTMQSTTSSTSEMQEGLTSREAIRKKFIEATIEFLERGEGIEAVNKVNVVRFGRPGILEIEVSSVLLAKDDQPQVSYNIISVLGPALIEGLGVEKAREILSELASGDGEHFTIHITTYSVSGDYRYQSDTDFDTMMKLHDKVITYEEWVAAANGGFR